MNHIAGKKAQHRLDLRASLSAQQIYEQYYAHRDIEKDAFLELWKKFGTALNINESKLRPSDRFDLELRPDPGCLLEDGSLELCGLVGKYINDTPFTVAKMRLSSLDQFVCLALDRKTGSWTGKRG